MTTNLSKIQYPKMQADELMSEERVFRVVFVSTDGTRKPELMTDGGIRKLTAGIKVVLGQTIRSNDCRVEIRDNRGAIFRLGQKAEFSIEQTENGISPVYYGEIYKGRISYDPGMTCGTSKYRTSCWVGCPISVYMRPTKRNSDEFFCFSTDCPIWEYDEAGRKFTIVHLDEGQKCTLDYTPNVPMRERYSVKNVETISDDEYDYIVEHFINPRFWR